MHSDLVPGDIVRVRGALWRLGSIARHGDCVELQLDPIDRARFPLPGPLTVLAPFDRPERVGPGRRVAVVSKRGWMRSLREALLDGGDGAALHAPVRASLDLLPYQLEPLIEVIRHGAGRLLLADAVGLGKTIQAGLILAELKDRHQLERALILTPPGLRDQWAAELRDRFAIDSTVADAAWLRAMRAEWPASLNPWSVPGVFVSSIDFAKRPEALQSLAGVRWDLVVVDEAHAASAESGRRDVAHLSACRARRVLLLTATPHGGDQAGFDALCRIGSLGDDDPIALFRRSRADAGMVRVRRVRLLKIRGTAAEAALRRELRAYVRAVWARSAGVRRCDARLAMIVLVKRSLSGMVPLLRSLEGRLDALGAAVAQPERQPPLPWDDDLDQADEVPVHALGAPGLEDPAEERRRLTALIRLARAAADGDSKRRALRRLLRRIRVPVIVFTEYRDTLASLAEDAGDRGDVVELHGGLDRRERLEAVARFTTGAACVLLATDAAGVGLNLHQRCRVVVNLELPWNPMRIEQRIGRVDRIGQSGVVHAINLLARGTAESAVLARLARRLERAAAAVGSIEGVLGWSDEAIAGRWLGCNGDQTIGGAAAGQSNVPGREETPPYAACDTGSDLIAAPPEPAPADTESAPRVLRPDRREDAAALVADLRWRRRLWIAQCRLDGGGPHARRASSIVADLAVLAVEHRRLAMPLRAGGVLALVRVDGRTVPVFLEGPLPRLRRRADVRAAAAAFLQEHGASAIDAARAHLARSEDPGAGHAGGGRGPIAVRDARLALDSDARRGPVQPGLFDRRGSSGGQCRYRPSATGEMRPAPVPVSPGAGAPGGARPEAAVAMLLFVTTGAGAR